MVNWYNRVYLCVNTDIRNWNIKKFDSFESADKYFQDTKKSNGDETISTMIPICRFIPSFLWLDKYVIKSQLSKMFLNIKASK